MMESKGNTAENIKELRRVMDITQQQFSDMIGFMDRAIISSYENGKRKPGIRACYKIIEVCKERGIEIDLEFLRPDESKIRYNDDYFYNKRKV